MRKLRFLVLALGLAYLMGCGGSEDLTVGGPEGPQDPGLLPPGNVINRGTGPVLSEDEAIERILSQFLGLAPLAAQARAVRVGRGTEPFLNTFIVPGGPFPAGTAITDWDEPGIYFTTDQPYYLFWVDPAPNANLGHPCSFLYLRAADGLLVQQQVDFDPIVAGLRPLEGDAAKANNLIYTHETWERLGYASFQARALQVRQVRQPRSVGAPGGPQIGGLGVAGAPERRREADMELGRDLYESMGGDPAEFDVLDDDVEDSRIDSFDLEEALAEASEGLGPNDKFLFVLSSHGGPRGTFQVGTDSMSWEVLCALIDQNVTAGNVNLVLDTCYSGLAVEGFAAWEGKSGKRVRIITSTGATPSYSRNDGAGFNLECVIMKLRDKLLEYGTNDVKGELTLEELEQAMTEVDVSAEEIREKLCESMGDVPGADVPQWVLDWKDDYDDETSGDIDKSDGSRKSGFDDRPDPRPEILKFFQDWSELIEDKDVTGLTPFYVPGFLYNGQNVTQVNRLGGTAQIDVLSLDLLDVESPGLLVSYYDVHFDLALKRSQAGAVPIEQEERHNIRVRLEPKAGSGYEIETQQSLTQDTFGVFSPSLAPPIPAPLQIAPFGIRKGLDPLEVGDPVQPGELLTASATVTGLMSGSTGFTFAGQLITLQPQGGGVFLSAPFPAPDRQPGFYLLSVFAENRTVLVPGQVESFNGQTRTLELVYP